MNAFDEEVQDRIASNGRNQALRGARSSCRAIAPKYSYTLVALPSDIRTRRTSGDAGADLAVQPDLIVRPDCHGGSRSFGRRSSSSTRLRLPQECSRGRGGRRHRAHNRSAIGGPSMIRRITIIEGRASYRRARPGGVPRGCRARADRLDAPHPATSRRARCLRSAHTVGSCCSCSTPLSRSCRRTRSRQPVGSGTTADRRDRYLLPTPEFEIDGRIDTSCSQAPAWVSEAGSVMSPTFSLVYPTRPAEFAGRLCASSVSASRASRSSSPTTTSTRTCRASRPAARAACRT